MIRIGIVMRRYDVNGVPVMGNNLMYFRYFSLLRPDFRVIGISPFEKEALSSICDVVVLPGGRDILSDDCWLSQPADNHYEAFERNKLEELKQMPVIGICRGFQSYMAKVCGWKIEDKLFGHKQSLASRSDLVHEVVLNGEWLDTNHSKKIEVNSIHNQGFYASDIPPTQWSSICTSKFEGVVEGIELANQPFIGFQFHPEEILGSFADALIVNFLNNRVQC
jgi:gamma-glutamyl-gamma-aminobutyrate hydrolase PuuD